MTRTEARQISGPVPSPSMNGMIGLSGTASLPLWIVIFAFGTNFYPYFYPHYVAAVTCLFLLVSVVGLERLSRFRMAGREMARVILGEPADIMTRASLHPALRKKIEESATRVF